MRAVTIAVLGGEKAREVVAALGKGKTEGDVARHHHKKDDASLNLVAAAKYPERVQGVSQCLLIADHILLIAERVDRDLGLLVLAADAAGLPGEILTAGALTPDAMAPLVADTALAAWPVAPLPEVALLREQLLDLPPGGRPGTTRVPVEQAFPVRGVGTVVLGAVTHGTVKRHQELAAFPGGGTCTVRSIQVHDDDVTEAVGGARVGLALRGIEADVLGRGTVLAPANSMQVIKAGETLRAEVRVPRFYAAGIQRDDVLHAGLGLQVVPVRVTGDVGIPAGGEGETTFTVETAVATAPGDRILLWDLDHTALRFAGGGRVV